MSAPAAADCQRMIERISAYLDGELTAAQCRTVERHSRACPRCAAIVAGLRRTIGLCHRAGRTPLPASVRARARAGVRRLLKANRGMLPPTE